MNEEDDNNKEIKAISHEEQKGLINQSEKIMAKFQRLDGEIKFSSKDLQNQFNAIGLKLNEWSDIQSSLSDTLEKNLTELARETTVLTALPSKIEKHLNQIIPNIAGEIQKKVFQEFESAINSCHKSVDQLNDKIQVTSKKLLEINQNIWRKKLIQFALVLSITIFGSSLLTYSIMRLFPQTVRIDTKGDITIDGGKVSIWEMGGNKTQIKRQHK